VNRARRFSIICAALAVLMLAGCASPEDKGGPDPQLRGQWELQKATDNAGIIPLANQLISLTIDGDTTTTGRSTCGNYRAHVYGDVTSLWITATLPPVEKCDIQVQQVIEHRYIADLNKVRTSMLAGGILDLLAPGGVDLQYQRALTAPLTLVVDRSWKLASIGEDSYYSTSNPAAFPEAGASLKFSRSGMLSGRTGCRTFTARYAENAGEVVGSGLRTTRFWHCDNEAQTVDRDVLDVLESGFTFLSSNGGLQLTSPGAEVRLGFTD
jgi:heat shock protein HslJ